MHGLGHLQLQRVQAIVKPQSEWDPSRSSQQLLISVPHPVCCCEDTGDTDLTILSTSVSLSTMATPSRFSMKHLHHNDSSHLCHACWLPRNTFMGESHTDGNNLKPKACTHVYTGHDESILASGVTAWYGNTTVAGRKRLQRVIKICPALHEGRAKAVLRDKWSLLMWVDPGCKLSRARFYSSFFLWHPGGVETIKSTSLKMCII